MMRARAFMRRWAFDGIEPTKERNEKGRMAWPMRFRFLPITAHQIFESDVPLISNDDWIPVDEALPEISTPLDPKFVWVYVPDLPYGYGEDKCQHLACRYDQIGWRVVGSNTDRVVTHWRPLPGVPA